MKRNDVKKMYTEKYQSEVLDNWIKLAFADINFGNLQSKIDKLIEIFNNVDDIGYLIKNDLVTNQYKDVDKLNSLTSEERVIKIINKTFKIYQGNYARAFINPKS